LWLFGQTTFYHQLEAQHLPASPLEKGRKPNTPSTNSRHLADFVGTYNLGRRLKTSHYEFICKTWASQLHNRNAPTSIRFSKCRD
jgi:hypothetical protein